MRGAKLPRMDLVTWDEFVGLPDDDRRELIDGELVEVEVPTFEHDRIVSRLCQLLWNWMDAHEPGGPKLLNPRWAMSLLRGPMTKQELLRAREGAG